ncbi:unnamed protein product, partial [Heterotrigona itama]
NSPFVHSALVFSLQYNIKKREEVQEATQEEPNPLMRKKKTPEELAAEAEAEDEDEITSMYTESIAFAHHTRYTRPSAKRLRPVKSTWRRVKNEREM